MTSDRLAPCTARERALCRQAYMLGGFEVSSGYYDRVGDDVLKKLALAKYPDPSRELRKVTWDNYSVTYDGGLYRIQGVGDFPPCAARAAEITRWFRVTDDILRELLALPADPYLPEIETNLKKEAYKLGYQNAIVNHMLYTYAEAVIFVDSLSFYIPPEIEEKE